MKEIFLHQIKVFVKITIYYFAQLQIDKNMLNYSLHILTKPNLNNNKQLLHALAINKQKIV